MSGTIFLTVAALVYTVILTITFVFKQKINKVENRMFQKILFITILSMVTELSIVVTDKMSFLGEIVQKLFLVIILLWLTIFSIYTFIITVFDSSVSEESNIKKYKSLSYIAYITWLILSFLVFLYPIYFNDESLVKYTYGPSVNIVFSSVAVCMIYMFILLFIHRQNIKQKKNLPIIVLLILLTASATVQNINPGILLTNFIFGIVVSLMYFTIENPDVEMIEELYKNKTIIEKNNESTSNFLFKISQDIKYPVNKIIDESSEYDNYKQRLKSINNMSKDLKHTINNILDVSSMTTKELKVYDTRYNPKNLFDEVKSKIENELGSEIRLEYTLSPNIPKFVYGDSIKLKQILLSILENSLKNTANGFISIEINTIIKYGICRFIIDISDSGKGISIDKVNQILSLDEINDKHDFDNSVLSLIEVRALIKKLDGNFMLKSELGKGTIVNVSIDQKIVESNEKRIIKPIKTYENIKKKGIKVIVIDDDAEELANITSYIEENNINVSGSLFGKEVIENIKNHQKYDLIILDDETNTYSALSILRELNKIKGFNIPVIVMINDNKDFIKKHYLEDGFNDIIKKSDLKKEVERVIKNIK